ncbi:cyclic nucleotide-binding domain-containing protein [Hymenobacter sp. BT730]|uniref:cyclic nucleotide-binding domain-containing protein n=1 Tax=Hymenobacter sp. BT730 TaxID=3063332 RepID=UPI0026DFC200|nr:cyclic nucleotide-binding domain-containing protein [Hymenobacter sp. BT730]
MSVRSGEVKTVWLFFLHNFLLGVGTILVYVVANVILLENAPERNLPLAYAVGAVAMMGLGKAYSYYEHHLLLKRLAVRVLLAVVVLTAVIGMLVTLGHSVVVALIIMTGYRLIYLLTNLEFWGVSAVVFNVRQGRRLFSVISSGDMPAKALGAILAVFVHQHSELLILLLTAFAAYLAALYTQQKTFHSHVVEAKPGPLRRPRREATPLVQQLLGGNPLVLFMGLSMAALAAVAAGVEFFFFVNVKQKLHDQTTILQYVGGVLAATYLVAMLFKLLLTHRGLDRLGMRWTLLLLPLTALVGIGLFGGLQLVGTGTAGHLAYFCGLYLALEVLRRAVFEPVFLVLFQPLTPQERLKGHTLVKGFYEPLGMGLAGLLLYSLHRLPELNAWVPFVWMGLLLLGALVLLQRTYGQYLEELKTAVSRRFSDPASQSEQLSRIQDVPHTNRNSPTKPAEPAASLAPLQPLHPNGPDEKTLQADNVPFRLHQEPFMAQTANRDQPQLTPADTQAQLSLGALHTTPQLAHRLAALDRICFLPPEQQVALVNASLSSPELIEVRAAIRAAGLAHHPVLTRQLISLLKSKTLRRAVTDSLIDVGATALPLLREALNQETDYPLVRRLTQVCARQATPESRALLVEMAQQTNLTRRMAALQALGSFASEAGDTLVFQRLVQEEMRLAQLLLHGMLSANVALRACLRYELSKVAQRLFQVLLQLYERKPILDAQRGIAHSSRERQANSLEVLDNLIPRPLYQGLQALLEVGRLQEKVQLFDELLGPVQPESVVLLVLERGEMAFSPWTISMALRQWKPLPVSVSLLYPHLHSSNSLLQESAFSVLRQLPEQQPAAYQQLRQQYPAISAMLMSHTPATSRTTALERVLVLKCTTLFSQTPENVLSNIVPIMKEVTFQEGETIFSKGDLGTSLFIVYDGEVGIFNGSQQLATFRKGDFFGELALLDTEPRSASAVALGEVVAFRLDQEDFYDVMEECSEVLHNILRVLCQRLRLQNEKMQAYSSPHAV